MAEHDQQFNSVQEWVNKGNSWLTRRLKYNSSGHPYFLAVCFDTKNRLVSCGGDFERAEKDGAFPVRWLWPDQVAEIAAQHPLFQPSYHLEDDKRPTSGIPECTEKRFATVGELMAELDSDD